MSPPISAEPPAGTVPQTVQDPPVYITAKQAARMLAGVSDKLVYLMVARGELTGLRVGRVFRVLRSSVEEYLREHVIGKGGTHVL